MTASVKPPPLDDNTVVFQKHLPNGTGIHSEGTPYNLGNVLDEAGIRSNGSQQAHVEPPHQSRPRPAPTPTHTHIPAISLPIKYWVDWANSFLATSPPDFVRERQHECNRVEQLLMQSGNYSGYEFLETPVRDFTRRRYAIVPRLFYGTPYNQQT